MRMGSGPAPASAGIPLARTSRSTMRLVARSVVPAMAGWLGVAGCAPQRQAANPAAIPAPPSAGTPSASAPNASPSAEPGTAPQSQPSDSKPSDANPSDSKPSSGAQPSGSAPSEPTPSGSAAS